MNRGRRARGRSYRVSSRRGYNRTHRQLPNVFYEDEESATLNSQRFEELEELKVELPGYHLYYQAGPPMLSSLMSKIRAAHLYLTDLFCPMTEKVAEQKYFQVNCPNLLSQPAFVDEWATFKDDLVQEPIQIVTLWSAVMHKIICEAWIASNLSNIDEGSTIEKLRSYGLLDINSTVHVGFQLTEPLTALHNVLVHTLNKMIVIRGQVVGSGFNGVVCTSMPFECRTCSCTFPVEQPLGLFTTPTKCIATRGCNSKEFTMRETHESRVTTEIRKIQIRDPSIEAALHTTVKCELFGELVDACGSGDFVTITGMPTDINLRKTTVVRDVTRDIVVRVIGIYKDGGRVPRTVAEHDSTLQKMIDTSKRESIFRFLVASLCPSIYGQEYIKAALVLSLLGGASDEQDGVMKTRNDINILMIGDPSVGKSNLLTVVSKLALRGVSICGPETTPAGLTAAVVRDSEGLNIRPGALVLADGGTCVIDELDKMKHTVCLLEAMEQQSVTVAKNGMYRTFPARANIVAAANPKGSHYNVNKSLTENVKFGSPLLSRFDLIFVMIDKANEETDRRILAHLATSSATNQLPSARPRALSNARLIDRLQPRVGDTIGVISHENLRHIISYGKENMNPKLSEEAKEELKNYYLHIRVRFRTRESIQITTRQLEALVRLTQARAKADFSDIATKAHAEDVLEIFESTDLGLWGLTQQNLQKNKLKRVLNASSPQGPLKTLSPDLLPQDLDAGIFF